MLRSICVIITSILLTGCNVAHQESWKVETQKDWLGAKGEYQSIEIKEGVIYPQNDSAYFSTALKQFKSKQKLESITFKQTPHWDSWKKIPKTTPKMATNAPVFIPVANNDYWFLALYEGDTINGYHSWHSTNMKDWKHYGPVSTLLNKWVTSAEYVDGKFYIYFDLPNDEDPHLIIDDDLTDGKQGQLIGRVFNDPTHGSDAGVFRDEDGTFHIIYEDWSPIDPSQHSWDSPLAGHSESPDGITGFEPHEYPAPIDRRSKPTGEIVPYEAHPNQFIPAKDPHPYTYEKHEGEQDAYGDYTVIKVAGQYYIFCDFDSYTKEQSMRIGRWRSDDIKKQFVWDGEIGEGFHPDPTVGFAEGKFYCLVQRNDSDFVSEGPWVDGVEVRVGVDTNDNGEINQWTEFAKVKETYYQKEGFVKVVEAMPAMLNLSELDAGYGFKLEMRFTNKDGFYPELTSFEVDFVEKKITK